MTSMVIASLSAIHFFFNRRSALRRVLDYCNVLQKGPVHFHSGCKEGHNCQMRLVKMSSGDMGVWLNLPQKNTCSRRLQYPSGPCSFGTVHGQKLCTTLKPRATILCCYLQGNHQKPRFLRWREMDFDFNHQYHRKQHSLDTLTPCLPFPSPTPRPASPSGPLAPARAALRGVGLHRRLRLVALGVVDLVAGGAQGSAIWQVSRVVGVLVVPQKKKKKESP